MPDSGTTPRRGSGAPAASVIASSSESKKTIGRYGFVRWQNSSGHLHRVDGPAVIGPRGTKEWWQNGQPHREDGPAIIDIGIEGFRWAWYREGQLHREDGPAILFEFDRAEKEEQPIEAWYRDGKLHREDGPAVIWPDGKEEWYKDDKKADPPSQV